MSQEQNKTISGTVFDYYDSDSREYKQGRMPRVGQTVEFEDGRKYVFCRSTNAISQGYCVSANTYDIETIDRVSNINDRIIYIDDSGVVANQYTDGFFGAETNSHVYKIKGNTATNQEGKVEIELYDPLAEATVEFDIIFLTKNLASDVYLDNGGGGIHAGVAMATSIAGKENWFWVQYQGSSIFIDKSGAPGETSLVVGAGGALVDWTAGNTIVAQYLNEGITGFMAWLHFPSIGC